MLAVMGAGSIIGGARAIAHNDAQTAQNTKDIADLRTKVEPIPVQLAHIETKLDDLTKFEKARNKGAGD
jgi:hypothetical protein